jgi:hypothetical protein
VNLLLKSFQINFAAQQVQAINNNFEQNTTADFLPKDKVIATQR